MTNKGSSPYFKWKSNHPATINAMSPHNTETDRPGVTTTGYLPPISVIVKRAWGNCAVWAWISDVRYHSYGPRCQHTSWLRTLSHLKNIKTHLKLWDRVILVEFRLIPVCPVTAYTSGQNFTEGKKADSSGNIAFYCIFWPHTYALLSWIVEISVNKYLWLGSSTHKIQ